MPADAVGIALACISAMLMGFSKTGLPGASIPSVALMAAAFGPSAGQSVGAMLPLLLVGDVFAVTWYRRHAQWDRLLGLFPYVVLGMIPGYLVLYHWNDTELRPVLGWLILAMFAIEIGRVLLRLRDVPHRWWFTGAAGSMAGLATVVGNAGGPVMSLYLLSRGLLKEQFIGTAAWFFFLVNLSKIVPFWHRGILSATTLRFGLAMVPVVLFGAVVGVWLLPRMSQGLFKVLVWALAGLAAVWLIVG